MENLILENKSGNMAAMRIVKHLVAVSRDIGGVNCQTLSFKCAFPSELDEEKLNYLLGHQIAKICWNRLCKSPDRCLSDVSDVGQMASDQVLDSVRNQEDLDQAYHSLKAAQSQRDRNSCMICGRELLGGGACSTCLCDMSKPPPGTEYVRPP
jgi:hypothetical protein